MWDIKYKDKIVLALRAKYEEKQLEDQPIGKDIRIGSKSIPLHRESFFQGKFSMQLPEIVEDMGALERTVKYRSENRPQIIKTDRSADATFTFSILPPGDIAEEEDVLEKLLKIRGDMKRIWKQNVFYDMGKVEADTALTAWMDFKAFCLDGSLYGMIFLFELKEETVLGNFHCSFSKYDIWKPAVLKLFTTIQID